MYVIDIQMKDLQHSNVRSFIGACLEDTDVILVNEHCSRGSLLVYSSHVTFNYRRVEVLTRVWADAQHDGRPAKCRCALCESSVIPFLLYYAASFG